MQYSASDRVGLVAFGIFLGRIEGREQQLTSAALCFAIDDTVVAHLKDALLARFTGAYLLINAGPPSDRA